MNTASSTPRFCPQCGTSISDASFSLCPQCLMRNALMDSESPGPKLLPNAPSIEAVQSAFPNLEVQELIGAGGMGAVFKARQPKLDRFVALKILPESLASEATFRKRFLQEGMVLAKLNHPHVVTIHDFGESGPFFYLILEYINGVNLREAMESGRFTNKQALSIIPPICDALQYAHDLGILHRDIKPENILLDSRGRVKLADFGIAKLIGKTGPEGKEAESKPEGNLTDVGRILGTPAYMSPEQKISPEAIDPRADIYSLGVVLYELLTGELPPPGAIRPPSRSPITSGLDLVVMRALQKDPDKRQQNATEFKTTVELLGAGLEMAGSATPEAEPQGSGPWAAEPKNSGTEKKTVASEETGGKSTRGDSSQIWSAKGNITTPEHLKTLMGKWVYLYQGSGEISLNPESVQFVQLTGILNVPFGSIEVVQLEHFPWSLNPNGLLYIRLVWTTDGETKSIILVPHDGMWKPIGARNELTISWYREICRRANVPTALVPQWQGVTGSSQMSGVGKALSLISGLGFLPLLLLGLSVFFFLTRPGRFGPMVLIVGFVFAAVWLGRILFGNKEEAKSLAGSGSSRSNGPPPPPSQKIVSKTWTLQFWFSVAALSVVISLLSYSFGPLIFISMLVLLWMLFFPSGIVYRGTWLFWFWCIVWAVLTSAEAESAGPMVFILMIMLCYTIITGKTFFSSPKVK